MDRGSNPLGNLQCARRVGAREDERELVAAVAERLIGVACHGHDRRGDLGQEAVACLMAEGVVRGLEVVQVEHDQAECLVRGHASFQPLLERAVVQEAGQVVGPGADLDRVVCLRVLQCDRHLRREQLDQLELGLVEAVVDAEPLQRQHACRAVTAA